MTESNQDYKLLAKRLEKVEKQNRFLSRMLVLVVVVGCSFFVMGQQSSVPETIKAKRFAAMSEDGKERAILMSSSLAFIDNNGVPRVIVVSEPSGTGIHLHDERGNTRALMLLDSLGPQLCFYGQDGTVRTVMNLEDEIAQLSFFDTNEKGRIAVGVDSEQSGVLIRDATEQNRIYMGLDSAGSHLTIKDKNEDILFSQP